MQNYTIEEFWRRRLSGRRVASAKLIQGWAYEENGLDTFKEAPLTHSREFGDQSDPDCTPILPVSAPGAVGKSTLARQIAFSTRPCKGRPSRRQHAQWRASQIGAVRELGGWGHSPANRTNKTSPS